jgi:hypothetical protein
MYFTDVVVKSYSFAGMSSVTILALGDVEVKLEWKRGGNRSCGKNKSDQKGGTFSRLLQKENKTFENGPRKVDSGKIYF